VAQLRKIVEPFTEVNVSPSGPGKLAVTAFVQMDPYREGSQTGIALDGSGSMSALYGARSAGSPSSVFGKSSAAVNQISPVAQKVCAYLARKLDADGGTSVIYWATGAGGSQVQVVGDLTADQAETHTFGPPKDFGSGTQLLPAVRYFADKFASAPFGFYVFVTDGELHDLDEVKRYSKQLAQEIAARKRNPMKLILIGIGPDVNEKQMAELDDLDTGTEVDLWDHKLAAELRTLEQIFAEVVDRNARVADRGRVLDATGAVVKDYSDTGVPAFLSFEIPSTSAYFTLEVMGNVIHQGLGDSANVPTSQMTGNSDVTPPRGTPATAKPAAKPADPTPAKKTAPLPGTGILQEPTKEELNFNFDFEKPEEKK